jgi:hypothetical protein
MLDSLDTVESYELKKNLIFKSQTIWLSIIATVGQAILQKLSKNKNSIFMEFAE